MSASASIRAIDSSSSAGTSIASRRTPRRSTAWRRNQCDSSLAAMPYSQAPPGRADVLEAAAALKRDRERLGEQVARDLGVEHPPVEVREQPVRPAVVQLAERARVVARGDQELCVGSGHRFH